MTRKHKYAIANSPGRLLTTAGAISITLVIVTAILCGLSVDLLNGFGAWEFTAPLANLGFAYPIAIALLLGYPALYALSLLGEAWSSRRFFSWLGRRVRGSLCLLWTLVISAVLVLHVVAHSGVLAALLPAIAVFGFGGLAVRWIERQATPSWQPFARILPAGLLTLSAGSHAVIAVAAGVTLAPLPGLLASGAVVGSALLLLGSARDVVYRRQSVPRRLFCRDAMHRALQVS